MIPPPRARRAASDLARSFGLAVDEVRELHASNRLTVHLLPCDLVARIAPAAAADGARDELERALRLAEAGAPIGAPDPRVPATVHHREGLAITLWTAHAPRTDRALPADEYAEALARLHAAMRSAELQIPPLARRVEAALALVEDPARTPRLGDEDRTFLSETLTLWSDRVARSDAQQMLHSTLNPASCRVAEKAGFALEGTRREAALHADGHHDMHLHARIDTTGPAATEGAGGTPAALLDV